MSDRKDPQYGKGFGDGLLVAMAIYALMTGIGVMVRVFQ